MFMVVVAVGEVSALHADEPLPPVHPVVVTFLFISVQRLELGAQLLLQRSPLDSVPGIGAVEPNVIALKCCG
jgi:hypothetical protein